MTKREALNGKPYTGNPHVRFDAGDVALVATPRCESLPHKTCETRVQIATTAMRLLSLAASCLIAHGAYAAEIKWNSSQGGDMQVETNWSNSTKPTSSDTIKIARNNDKPITLSEDLTASGGNSYFAANFELALTNSAGVSRKLSLSKFYAGGGSKTVSLTAGTLAFSDKLYMGDSNASYTNDTFIVDGANTAFDGGTICVGTKCPNCTFVVQNGATRTGSQLYVGRNQFNDTSPSTNSCFRVTGAGSSATFSYANQSATDSGVSFGGNGLCRIEVLDGGCLSVTNLAVRRHPTYSAIPWYGDNSVRVSGAGSKVIVNGGRNKGFWLGSAAAPGCSVTVEDEATWESHGEFKIADDDTTNAVFRVASGARVSHDVYSVKVGTTASARNAALQIDNGVMECLADGGISVDGEDSHISISGAGAHLSSPNGAVTFNAGTRLEIEIPNTGFTSGEPPITCKTLTFDAGSSLVVTLEKANNPGGRVVLARVTDDITTLGNLSVTLPEGVGLDTSNAKELAVKVPTSGFVIFIK